MAPDACEATKGRAATPLDWNSDPTWVWTTVNTAETLTGVLMPLAWAFWEAAIENGMRLSFYDFGILRRSEVDTPPMTQERFTAVFSGRYAVSINAMRKIGDRMIGTDGNAVEEQILGSVGSGIAPQSQPGRYGVVLAKMPVAAAKLPKRLLAARKETEDWWKAQTAPAVTADLEGAAARFVDARARFENLMRLHGAATMIAQAAYDQVKGLSEAAGLAGLERRLVTGYGDFEESRIAAELWAVSRGRLSMEEFVGRHGYHGPREGAVDSPSWRQDHAPLLGLVEKYRGMPDSDDPSDGQCARQDERIAAEKELLSALGPAGRLKAKAILGFARRHVPLREVSKAAFLHAIDAGRAAAWSHGEWLARGGHIEDSSEVFFLDLDDVADRRTDGLRDVIRRRRAEREAYSQVYLPDMWTGNPTPIPLSTREAEDGDIAGIAVSSGVVEGRVRVVLDLEQDHDIEPGEILVCETTDPSWASWFVLASALVIDIGGVMSHGAIVAREMGVPCVINTRNGTRQLTTGDLVRVDGDAGTVTILERAQTIAN
jgi:pyruvate,water dikinase